MSTNTFWKNKRVLITGHTGFKGGWLAIWLNQLGAKVSGISLAPVTNLNLFSLTNLDEFCESYFCDIRDERNTKKLIHKIEPEVVFHLAAQPLVRSSYKNPIETYATNVMGTAHLLDSLVKSESIRVALLVTTDKVYRNLEWPYPYREDSELGGHDPYSASKAASEIVISSYRDSFLHNQNVSIASARAGNVIGGGDWSEDRLIPDAVRAWASKKVLEIRRPSAIRPWQHVLEPLNGYLKLAEKLWFDSNLAGAYNFGPLTHEAASVRDVIELAKTAYGYGEIVYGDGSEGPHEAGWLALEIAKARTELDVSPKWGLNESVNRTMSWYKRCNNGDDALTLCQNEITDYEAI